MALYGTNNSCFLNEISFKKLISKQFFTTYMLNIDSRFSESIKIKKKEQKNNVQVKIKTKKTRNCIHP